MIMITRALTYTPHVTCPVSIFVAEVYTYSLAFWGLWGVRVQNPAALNESVAVAKA